MKEKNTLGLCIRYSQSCKLCPRCDKCDEEIVKEKRMLSEVKYGKGTNKQIKVSNKQEKRPINDMFGTRSKGL